MSMFYSIYFSTAYNLKQILLLGSNKL
uniref:Uncharacterized protein n=1 Tax=Arundo donax TaxID=35708 RepID=A0A0A9EF98_ARUDO